MPATDGTLLTTSEESQTQLVEAPIDPTVAGTTCVTSTINQAIHGPKSSAKPTVTLAEEAIGTDATYTDLRELDEPAVPVLGDTAHDGTEGPSFVHSMTVIPSQDTSDTAEQTEDTLEMETATGEQRDQDEPRVEVPHDTNQASLESPSYVPPKIVIPSQDIISRVEEAARLAKGRGSQAPPLTLIWRC